METFFTEFIDLQSWMHVLDLNQQPAGSQAKTLQTKTCFYDIFLLQSDDGSRIGW